MNCPRSWELREARPEDAAQLLEFLQQVGSESDNLSFGAEGMSLTVEEEAALLGRMLKDELSAIYVLLQDDAIIANASFQVYRRERMRHRATIALSVRKQFWGQGIGSALMQHLLEELRKLGCNLVTLEVLAANERGIRLYEKFGFTKYGELDRFFCIDGVYRTAYYMKCDLV